MSGSLPERASLEHLKKLAKDRLIELAVARDDPALVRDRDSGGAAGLHRATAHPDAVRVLLEHGADPQGEGDVHHGDVIGWASREGNDAVIDRLLARGARHHIFSAIAMRDVELVERLVDENPDILLRRRSRFESGHTALHDAIAPPDPGRRPDYTILERLIELGADLDARDDHGRTPLDVAMLRGDRDAIRILKAAGAKETEIAPDPGGPTDVPAFAFEEDLYRPFYGGRQFSIRDLNGLHLIFWQP